MKKQIFTAAILLLSLSLSAQIKNPDFELSDSGNKNLPSNWSAAAKKGYTIAPDSSHHHSGKYALKITGTDSLTRDFSGVSQQIPVQSGRMRKAGISVYIKTADVKGTVAIWCQIWDNKANKMVGFENIASQQGPIAGTKDWTKYTLNLTLDSEVSSLFFGGYLAGTGSAWFDDFKFEEAEISNVPPADSVKKYIGDFTAIVKKHSIYRDSLNWQQIDTAINALAKGMKTVAEARTLTSYVIGQLRKAGDNHSFIQSKAVAQAYAKTNTSTQKVNSELLQGKFGYISVPAYGSTDQNTGDNFANDIQQRIRVLDTEQKLTGWIVDLRRNGGGNMHPMIAGLGPLTGEGTLGYFVSGSGKDKKYIPWAYKAKKGKNGTTLGVTLQDPYKLQNPNIPVAVLIGPGTGSSGEMTAISFIGRPNTKFFGNPSAGYTTANSNYPLSDGSMLLLAVSTTADRSKKEYKAKVTPEQITPASTDADSALEAAKTWLLEAAAQEK